MPFYVQFVKYWWGMDGTSSTRGVYFDEMKQEVNEKLGLDWWIECHHRVNKTYRCLDY